MIQEIIVCLLFMIALGYLGRLLYQNVRPAKTGACPKGCGSCNALDIKKLEEQLK